MVERGQHQLRLQGCLPASTNQNYTPSHTTSRYLPHPPICLTHFHQLLDFRMRQSKLRQKPMIPRNQRQQLSGRKFCLPDEHLYDPFTDPANLLDLLDILMHTQVHSWLLVQSYLTRPTASLVFFWMWESAMASSTMALSFSAAPLSSLKPGCLERLKTMSPPWTDTKLSMPEGLPCSTH